MCARRWIRGNRSDRKCYFVWFLSHSYMDSTVIFCSSSKLLCITFTTTMCRISISILDQNKCADFRHLLFYFVSYIPVCHFLFYTSCLCLIPPLMLISPGVSKSVFTLTCQFLCSCFLICHIFLFCF